MAHGDDTFTEQLKYIWDTEFSKNRKTILVLCGSVSSWIQDNILHSANFVGRISSQITLKDLLLSESSRFWRWDYASSYEKLKILCITGGVPKYLEELVTKESAESSIARSCFQDSGFLFNEYEKIFSEIFMRRAITMSGIVKACLNHKLAPKDLAHTLSKPLNADFSRDIAILEVSGFLARDFSFNPDGKISKFSFLRLRDNYLRFFLTYLQPIRNRILKGGARFSTLEQLPNWEATLGLQFENLILHSRTEIYPHLGIEPSEIISAAPYIQRANTRNRGGVQVDLLIHARRDEFYLCEVKCQRKITSSIIKEVQTKVSRIALPKRASVRPVLIFEGELDPNYQHTMQEYFYRIIPFKELVS
jgi:hypothetical protein